MISLFFFVMGVLKVSSNSAARSKESLGVAAEVELLHLLIG
jgi:hypothetical protein